MWIRRPSHGSSTLRPQLCPDSARKSLSLPLDRIWLTICNLWSPLTGFLHIGRPRVIWYVHLSLHTLYLAWEKRHWHLLGFVIVFSCCRWCLTVFGVSAWWTRWILGGICRIFILNRGVSLPLLQRFLVAFLFPIQPKVWFCKSLWILLCFLLHLLNCNLICFCQFDQVWVELLIMRL